LQGLWGSAFAGEIHVWLRTLLAEREELTIGKFIHEILHWTELDDWRPLAANLPNYMDGILAIPQSKRRIHCDLKRMLPPGNDVQVNGQQGVSFDTLKAEKGTEQVHRAGRVSRSTTSRRPRLSSSVNRAESLTVVDAGLDFNLPFPPLLRPERSTDMFLVFDYSWYGSQEKDPFGELRKAKQWADENGYKFPIIPDDIFDKNQPKEYYVLEDANDPDCPIVVFFSLCNVSRRHVGIPGQDKSFAEVDPFDPIYDTFNFEYTENDFQRLHELCYYNTTLAVEDIKRAISRKLK
jgi:hypothetical protein